jgi:hypothetical protein
MVGSARKLRWLRAPQLPFAGASIAKATVPPPALTFASMTLYEGPEQPSRALAEQVRDLSKGFKTMRLTQLIYTSRPFGFDDLALMNILLVSRRNNERDGITGSLGPVVS